jgi:CheY-like chemotaxis protein
MPNGACTATSPTLIWIKETAAGKPHLALSLVVAASGVLMGTVLIVDDEHPIRDALATVLEAFGMSVVTAGDGRRAIAEFQRHRPRLVLTDVLMPVMDGIEVIREIRRIDPLAKIVAMSGGTRDANWCPLKAAGLLGADRILEKPFDTDVLAAAIRELLP